LRDVSAALAHQPHATVAVSSMRVHPEPEQAEWKAVRGSRYRGLTGQQLAAYLYGGFSMPFCSAVYRTDVLKHGDFRIETYGKIFDRPFVIEAARTGSAVVMLDAYVKYRIHARQDSADQATGPFLPEVFALQRYYRQVLGERLTDSAGRIFLRRNYRNLLGEYTRLNRNAREPMTVGTFFRGAIEAEAASKKSLRWGKFYFALTQLPRRLERGLKALVRPKGPGGAR
jgi:hypothetical protein